MSIPTGKTAVVPRHQELQALRDLTIEGYSKGSLAEISLRCSR